MKLMTPACYKVFSGTLDQGIFSEERFETKGDSYATEQKVHNVDFSGRYVAALLRFCPERNGRPNEIFTDLNTASIRCCQCTDINLHHHWGRVSLEKLKSERGITLVDSKPRMVTTVSDLRYQERLESFYKKTSPHEVICPIFTEKSQYDPKTLAACGWEYAPREFNSTEEAELSLRYFMAKKKESEIANQILQACLANDAIKSYSEFGCIKIYGFQDNETLLDAFHPETDQPSTVFKLLVTNIKEICDSSLLSVDNQPQEAVVVKLAGYNDLLLTTAENIDILHFKPFSHNDLLSYFRDSWQEHLSQIDSKEFENNSLPTLSKILPTVDKNYQVIVNFIDILCGMEHALIEVIKAHNINLDEIKEKSIEFQSLYRKLVLTQKQIEFYQIIKELSQQNIDTLNEGSWQRYYSLSTIADEDLAATDGDINYDREEFYNHFKEWFVEFHLSEKEKAVSRLKVLDRELSITKLKIGIQSDLEGMLINLTGKLISLKYSSGNSELNNDYQHLSIISNEILALIALNKLTLNGSGSRSLESLDLAADLIFDQKVT